MSVEKNKAVVRRMYNLVDTIDWVKRDYGVIDNIFNETIDDEYTYHHPNYVGFEPGPNGLKKWYHQIYDAVSELHVTVEDIFGEGDKVVTRTSFTFIDMQTGKPAKGQSIVISYFRNGKITEEWELFNEQLPVSME